MTARKALIAWLGLAAVPLLVPAAVALEINDANRAQLEQLDGIGVPLAARILDERAARGPFVDWADLERRVKGLRAKTLDRLGAQGLTVAGQPRMPAGRAAARDSDGAQR
jgi:competence protein ComEA